MALEDTDLLAARHLPQPRRLVTTGRRHHPPPIRAERGPQHIPVMAVASFRVLACCSADAITRRPPARLTAVLTPSPLHVSPPISLPLATSHSRAVLSPDAVTTCRPSGLNAALATSQSWPLRTPICLP